MIIVLSPYMLFFATGNALWDNLYAAYKAESNANDELGVYNGTAQGGLTYATGKDGNAFVGNGTNAYVSFADNSFNLSDGFSINVWVNISSSTTNSVFVSNYYYSGAVGEGGWVLEHRTNGNIRFYMCTSISTVTQINYSYAGNYSGWHMITILKPVGALSTAKMYIDNVLVASALNAGTPYYYTTNYASIGVARYVGGSSGYLENGGKTDEVYLWDREITADEVTELYNAGAGTYYNPIVYSYLLDTYSGSAMAYSMYKLRSAYSGSCLRVRRSSDNTEQDIGFVSNYIDTASLTTFVGANDGFVVKWYDQSGNAYDVAQSTASRQPKIVSSGSLVTSNGKASMLFDGVDDYLSLANTTFTGSVPLSSFEVFDFQTLRYSEPLSLTNTTNLQPFYSPFLLINATQYGVYKRNTSGTSLKGTDFGTAVTGQQLLTFYSSGTLAYNRKNANLLVNGYDVNVGTIDINTLGIGALVRSSISAYTHMKASEVILYNSNQVANVADIESNINTRFTIY